MLKKTILLFVSMLFMSIWVTTNSSAEETFSRTDQTIAIPSSLDQLKENTSKDGGVVQLSNSAITMYGLNDTTQFFYNVPVASIGDNNYLELHYRHSPLLKEPSSMTVLIDNVPIESIPLIQKEDNKNTVRIPLPDAALEEGFHSISISFYGHIMDGICVNEDHSANWFTLYPESLLYLDISERATSDFLLQDFPYPFVQPGFDQEIHTAIVIPDQPSSNELEAALFLSSYLQTQISSGDRIEIISESSMEAFRSHYIVIGKTSSFNGTIKSLVGAANLSLEDDHLTIANYALKGEQATKQVLFITANTDSDISEKIHVLTEQDYINQLAGTSININRIPSPKKENYSPSVTFEDLQIGNLTLSGVNSLSQNYFYKVPANIDENQQAYLQLKLKKSEVLTQLENEITNNEAELTIWLNNVPHSVAIERLTNMDESGYYSVEIPVDPALLNQSSFLEIKFEAMGLHDYDICVPADNSRWIYLDQSSYLFVPQVDSSTSFNFSKWPSPYVTKNNQSETTIVIPNAVTLEDIHQLQNLISSMYTDVESLRYLNITYSSDVTDDMLKQNDLLFIGGTEIHPILKEQQTNLLVNEPEKNGDITPYQLLNETTIRIAYIQPSPWNEEHALTVFTKTDLEQNNLYLSEQMLLYLKENGDPAYIVAQNINNDIFTYQAEEEKNSEQVTKTEFNLLDGSQLFIWIGLSLLFVLSIVLFIIMIRRKKKQEKLDQE